MSSSELALYNDAKQILNAMKRAGGLEKIRLTAAHIADIVLRIDPFSETEKYMFWHARYWALKEIEQKIITMSAITEKEKTNV